MNGGGINKTYLERYAIDIIQIVNDLLVPVLISIAFLVFLFGVYQYFIQGAANEESREKGRTFVFWGIIGFVIILSVWGIIRIVGSTLGLQPGGGPPPVPTFNTSGTQTPPAPRPSLPSSNSFSNPDIRNI